MKVLVAQLCSTLRHSMDYSPPGSSVHRILSKNAGVGCHFLLQGIFPTQGWIPGLLHCRQILYWLRHQGNQLINLSSVRIPGPVQDTFLWTGSRAEPTASRAVESAFGYIGCSLEGLSSRGQTGCWLSLFLEPHPRQGQLAGRSRPGNSLQNCLYRTGFNITRWAFIHHR